MNARQFVLLAALVLLTAGCGPSGQDLAKQIVVEKVELRPDTRLQVKPCQSVVVHIRNDSPYPIASIDFRLTPYDAQGKVIRQSVVGSCGLFSATTPEKKIPPGGRGQTPDGAFFLDSVQRGRPAARVEAVAVEAGTVAGAEM